MCYCSGIKVTKWDLEKVSQLEREIYSLLEGRDIPVRNGFEFRDFPIVKSTTGVNGIVVEMAHWEFIPPWLKKWDDVVEGRKKFNTLNAKAENLFMNEKGKPSMWADAALHRRCIIPSTGFYEWRHFKPLAARKEIAYPYVITVLGVNVFYMAGIWQQWTDKSTGETVDTFAIVTTEANSFMAQIHNTKKRMPTILTELLAEEWLSDGLNNDGIIEIAKFQIPSSIMQAKTIDKDFRSRENPEEHYVYPELPEIMNG